MSVTKKDLSFFCFFLHLLQRQVIQNRLAHRYFIGYLAVMVMGIFFTHNVAQSSETQASQPSSTSVTSSSRAKVQTIKIRKFYAYNLAAKRKKEFLSIPAIQQSIGKTVSMSELKRLAKAIDTYSRNKGWKYRARLLPLNRSQGIVSIDVRHESDWTPTPKTDAQGNKLITVRYFFSYGQARFDKKAIKAIPAIRESRGQTMTIQKLAALAKPINDYYHQRNLAYKARVEPKDFENGIVAITVVPRSQSNLISSKSEDMLLKTPVLPKASLPTKTVSKKVLPQKKRAFDSKKKPTPIKLSRVNIKINNNFLKQVPMEFQNEIQSEIGSLITPELYSRVSQTVVDYYRKHGYFIANALVKPNPQHTDEIDVYVFAGEIEKVVIDNQSNYSFERIKNTATQNICKKTDSDCAGSLLTKGKVERTIGIIGDLPGLIGTKISLTPGQRQGTTIANVSVQNSERARRYVSVDNYGNKITGKNRATAGLISNNWAGIGDQLVFELTTTNESNNTIGQLGYSLPILYDGWRAGLNFSQSQYYLYEDFKDAQIKGKSNTYSLWASYPIIRTKNYNLSTRLSYENSNPKDSILNMEQPQRRIHGFSASLNGQLVDRLWRGRSFSNYGITLQQKSIKADADYQGSIGSFSRLLWNISRDQELLQTNKGNRLSAYFSLRGQEAKKTMDASMRYSLGGLSGVRAYPGGEAPGDRGVLGTLELRYGIYLQPMLPGFLTLAVFHDRGWKKNAAIGTGDYGYGNKSIYGNGISLNLSILDQWSIKAEWAKRDKNSASAITEDNPSDSRFWLTGSVNF